MPVTRFGLEGYGVRRAGSFAGKTPEGGGPHPVGVITRFGLEGYGVRRAGSFAGRAQQATGTLSVTEGADTAAISGNVLIQGTLSATEGADSASFTGVSIREPSVGSSISGGTFSRGRWRAMRDAQDAHRKLTESKRKKKKKRLSAAAIEEAGEAIEAAKLIGEYPHIGAALNELTGQLEAVNSEAVIATAQLIKQLVAEQEDEEDIEFLLMHS